MQTRRIVVVGGVAGGATAAARARRTDEHAQIVLFEKGEHISFANCGLPYYIGGEIGDRSALLLQTPESFRSRFNVDVRVRHEVLAINPASKQVKVRNLSTGMEYEESYTTLILAPGAKPIRPTLPGIDKSNIYTLRNVPDADEIRAIVDARAARKAVVVGAGFIGLEMVENLARAGLAVTLVEKAPQVLPPLDPEMSLFILATLNQMGVEVITGDGIASFIGQEQATAVVLDSGREVDGDLFVLGIGVAPDLALARGAGLTIGESGGIWVDEFMRTSDPHIFAAGDAVECVHVVTGKVSRVPLAGPANKQGRVAGANAAGDNLMFSGALGTAIVRVGEAVAGMTGLSEQAARKAGFAVAISFTVSGDHADYYPGAQDMVVKVVYEQCNGRLLGAQVVGSAGVDKRIDVLATAIMGGMDVNQLANLDLAYAPPFGSAKDPVIVAGMVAQNQLRGQLTLITPPELGERQLVEGDLQIVDVRPAYEANLGTIPGALNIYVDELRARLGELDPQRPTVVFDQNGAKGYVAARILAEHGFKVSSLSGGYIMWSAYEGAGVL